MTKLISIVLKHRNHESHMYRVAQAEMLFYILLDGIRPEDIDQELKHDDTLLSVAIKNNAPVKLIDAILDHGADANRKYGPFHDEPLLLFLCRDFDENAPALQTLLAHVTNINIVASMNMTALHYAVLRNHIQHARVLIDSGANMDLQDYRLFTPLMYAVGKQSYDMVRLLLEKGAETQLTNNDGETAMDIAKRTGDRRIIDLLAPYFPPENNATNGGRRRRHRRPKTRRSKSHRRSKTHRRRR